MKHQVFVVELWKLTNIGIGIYICFSCIHNCIYPTM